MNLKRIKDVAWGFCLVQLIWGFMQLIFNIISTKDSKLLYQEGYGQIYSDEMIDSIAKLLKTSAIIIGVSLVVTVLYLIFSNLPNKILSSVIFKISFSAIILGIIWKITSMLYHFKDDVKIIESLVKGTKWKWKDINDYQYAVSAQGVVLVPYFSLVAILILMIIECFKNFKKELSLENKQENN